ncbi:MAG: hypothetical protein RI894_273, partial [Bacteroidota bacterium]
MNKTILFFALLGLILSSSACRNKAGGKVDVADLNAGTITFSISQPKDGGSTEGGFMAGMMPKEATMYFDNDQAAIEVSMMGLVTMRLISNARARTETVLISGMGGKQASVATEADLKPMLDSLTLITEETKETKEILGVMTTKYLVRDTVKHTESAVFIAKDAPVGNLYWCLPIGKLKGLILGYETANGASNGAAKLS